MAQMLDAFQVRILDTKKLPYQELSGMAYKDSLLYIVSDDAKLYSFYIEMKNSKITKLKHLKTQDFKDKKHKALSKKESDAEGLCFMGENLLISFERDQRVELFDTCGVELKKVKIHKKLRDKKDFVDENQGLESVAYSEKYGVMTAPQSPLKNKDYHTIYAKKKSWHFNAKGKIAAFEFINEDNLIVLLLDEYFLIGGKKSRIYHVDLDQAGKNYEAELLFEKDGSFEGLAKVKEGVYLMVSDSEGGFFQKTELVLFELH